MALSFLFWLRWCDYIRINWRKIDADIFHLVARVRKEERQSGSFAYAVKKFMTHTLPLMTGFAVAFKKAFEGH